MSDDRDFSSSKVGDTVFVWPGQIGGGMHKSTITKIGKRHFNVACCGDTKFQVNGGHQSGTGWQRGMVAKDTPEQQKRYAERWPKQEHDRLVRKFNFDRGFGGLTLDQLQRIEEIFNERAKP